MEYIMQKYRVLSHPTIGVKAVKESGWSWVGFFFFGWYFLIKKDYRALKVQLGILAAGCLLFVIGFYFYFTKIITALSIWLTPIALWVHGGKFANSSMLQNLLSQGYETVFETHANNANHALAQYEKSKQSA